MRSLLGILGAAILMAATLPGVAWAWGEIRVATTDLNVRAERNADSPKVVTLKKGQRIKVDFIEGKWAAVFPESTADRDLKNAIGFAGIRYLQYVSPAPDISSEDVVVAVKPEPLVDATEVQADTEIISESDNAVVGKVKKHADEMNPSQGGNEKAPVKITSDRMVYNEAKGTVVFEGSVRADHQGLVLFSETLTAYFAKDARKKEGEDQIEKIVAGGGVKVERDTTQGRCQTLTYMVQSGVLRMEGNPILEDGENTITGQVIKFYMKDNRSEVVGGKNKRVQAVFTAPGKLEP